MTLTTPLCERLGITLPVVQAPIGSATRPALAAAVSGAGGLGMLAVTWRTPAQVADDVARTRELTAAPFGVNVVLDFAVDAQLDVALDLGVRVVSTFWGDPGRVHERIAAAGALHLHTVGSPEEARQAVDAGVDVVVAQGVEAGGHVRGTTASLALVPAVVDAVAPVPVVAAGGIADGRGLAAALVLGAQAVWVGTRFVASAEANTHDVYRARVLAARSADAVYTTCFDGGWPDAPHRALRNRTLDAWESAGRPAGPGRPDEGTVVATDGSGYTVRLYDDQLPLRSLQGEVDRMAMYAGQSVGLIGSVEPAADIVASIVDGARQALAAAAAHRP